MKILPIESIEVERIFTLINTKEINTLAITSPQSGEGVSTLSLGLAKRSAAHGDETLLVDLNLNHSSISQHFGLGINVEHSFVETMTKNVYSSPIHNLSILPAPSNSEFIFEMRSRDKLTKMWSLFQKNFKFKKIYIDCSAVNVTSKNIIPADIVASSADGYILNVLSGKSTETNIHDATFRLKAAKANIVGSVFNDAANPRLNERLCMLTHRLDFIMPARMKKLREKIRSWNFLSFDI